VIGLRADSHVTRKVVTLSGRHEKTFILLDARALLKTQSDLLGAAHSVVEVLWVVHERDKLVDAAANTLLVEQDERLVAKSCTAGNEAEQLVECCDAGIGSSLGQLAQLLLRVLLEHHNDKEFFEALFKLCEVLQLFASRDCWPVARSRGIACAALRVATRLLCAWRDSYG
jgi:hypothetical protein